MIKKRNSAQIVDPEANKQIDWWNDIGKEEKASVDRGLRQLKKGKGIPHEDVVKQYPKWFNSLKKASCISSSEGNSRMPYLLNG
jgi:predicted transcriptional regulator